MLATPWQPRDGSGCELPRQLQADTLIAPFPSMRSAFFYCFAIHWTRPDLCVPRSFDMPTCLVPWQRTRGKYDGPRGGPSRLAHQRTFQIYAPCIWHTASAPHRSNKHGSTHTAVVDISRENWLLHANICKRCTAMACRPQRTVGSTPDKRAHCHAVSIAPR